MSQYSNIQSGDYKIGQKTYHFRSKAEANYALYLNFLLAQKQIKKWRYEPQFYEFPVKHGATRYLPDFEITKLNGTLELHEVKGRWTGRARMQVKRMAKFYPEIPLIVIDMDYMRTLYRQVGKLLKFY